MATFKVSFILNLAKQGWTETLYVSISEDPNSLAIRGVLRRMAIARDKLVGTGASVEAVKYADVAAPRTSWILDYTNILGGVSGERGQEADIADVASTAVGIRFRTAAGDKRMWYLRGLPDSWTVRGVASNIMSLNDLGADKVRSYAKGLIANGVVLMRVRKKPGVEDGAKTVRSRSITNMTAAAVPYVGLYSIESTDVAGISAADRVIITGAKGSNVSRALGVHTVVAVVDGKVVIDAQPSAFPSNAVAYAGKGVMRSLEYYYEPITSATLGPVNTRKAGRALFVPAGRRRARR